jgi:ribonuclease P protein component
VDCLAVPGSLFEMSLPQQHRLADKRSFRELFEKPSVSSDTCFKILAKPNGQSCSRLGMAISRKVDRRAVQRNRLKRLIRESFRQQVVAEEKGEPGAAPRTCAADYMVLPRREAVTISNGEVFERLARLWNNIARKLPQAEQDVTHTATDASTDN